MLSEKLMRTVCLYHQTHRKYHTAALPMQAVEAGPCCELFLPRHPFLMPAWFLASLQNILSRALGAAYLLIYLVQIPAVARRNGRPW